MRKCGRQFTLGHKHLYDSETLKLIHVHVYHVKSFSYHSIGCDRHGNVNYALPNYHLLCATPLPIYYVLPHFPFIMCYHTSHLLFATPLPIYYVLLHFPFIMYLVLYLHSYVHLSNDFFCMPDIFPEWPIVVGIYLLMLTVVLYVFLNAHCIFRDISLKAYHVL